MSARFVLEPRDSGSDGIVGKQLAYISTRLATERLFGVELKSRNDASEGILMVDSFRYIAAYEDESWFAVNDRKPPTE